MTSADIITILILLGLLLLSAYFSATETAFSSLNTIRLKNMADGGNRRAALALRLADNYDQLLSTILIGNNIVNIASASLATVLFIRHLGDIGATVSTVVTTVVVLIFAEVSPKSLAKESPEKFALFSAPILRLFVLLLTPLNFLFRYWKKLLSLLFKSSEDRSITEEELLTIVEEAEQEGGINEQESELIRSAIVWLCQLTGKPILKLTNKDYNENGLSELLALFGSAYNVNIKIFNDLQHTITGWPGGKPNADDTYRPERAKPYPKRVVVFSPHPDDDVISMGGTIRRLVEQKHDVHVAYETSGNIAVGDEEVIRFLHFINGFNQIFNNSEDQVINDKYTEIRKYLKEKKDGDMDTRDILTIKGLIRRGEARTACTYNNIPLDHCHFLDLPFYETGKIQKNPISEADVEIVRNLLREVKPHQIFVAGDLADPHGTHRVCTDAVFAAIDLEKEEGAKWLKECRIWMYRGAWAEWEIENIEMAVPISPEELRAKRNSILKHQSQMESAPFLGNDERLFWQRSEDRNRGTAALYDSLGLASYEAMEAFVEYIPL